MKFQKYLIPAFCLAMLASFTSGFTAQQKNSSSEFLDFLMTKWSLGSRGISLSNLSEEQSVDATRSVGLTSYEKPANLLQASSMEAPASVSLKDLVAPPQGAASNGEVNWTGGGSSSGDWSDSANWNGGNVPGAEDNVNINGGDNAADIKQGTEATYGKLTVGSGEGNSGSLKLDGGSLTGGNSATEGTAYIGTNKGTGTADINSGTWENTGNMFVGFNEGNGTLNVGAEGELDVQGNLTLGSNNGTGWADGTGTLNVNGGKVTVSNDLNVGGISGYSGNGTLNVNSGEVNVDNNLNVGAAGSGTMNVSSDGIVHVGNDLNVGGSPGSSGGYTGNGTLNVNGGEVNVDGNLNIDVYGGNSSSGTMSVSNGGNVTAKGNLTVGSSSPGNISVSSDGIVDVKHYFNLDNGTLNVNGGEVTAGDNLNMGFLGSGTMNVSNNGEVNVDKDLNLKNGTVNVNSGGEVHVDKNLNSYGTVSVSGGNLNVTNQTNIFGSSRGDSSLTITEEGTVDTGSIGMDAATNSASLNLSDGGKLSTNSIAAGDGAGSKQFHFDGGTLQAKSDNDNFISGFKEGEFTLGGNGTIDTQEHSVGINSPMSGGGGFTKIGTGTLTLTGKNDYSGGTFIQEGSLKGTTDSLQGGINLSDNTSLTFAQSGSGTFNGNISGTGDVTIDSKNGLVHIDKDHDQTYSGITDIKEGELALDSTLTDSQQITIEKEGTLSGVGTVNHDVTNSGWLKPGSDTTTGTFHIQGDYTQSDDGNILFKLGGTDPGQYDRLDVGGTANLSGSLHAASSNHFIPPAQSIYNVVHAEGGVQGQFQTEDTPLHFTTIYDDSKKDLYLKADWTDFVPIGPAEHSEPWSSLSDALLDAITVQNGEQNSLYDAIADLEFIPKDKIAPYLEQLTPELAGALKEILFNNINTQYGQITERLAATRAGVDGISLNGLNYEPMAQQMSQHEESLHDKNGNTVAYQNAGTSPWNIFATASGIFSNITTAQDLPNVHSTTGNFSAGMDCKISEHFNVGLFVGYEGILADFSNDARMRSNGLKFGGYGTAHWNGFYLNAMIGAGFNSFAINRPITLDDDHWLAKSAPSGAELDSLLGGGYEYTLDKWRFGVNASLQYTYLGISSFTEYGAGALDLKVDNQNPGSMMSTLGANITYTWDIAPNIKLIPIVGMAWQHQFLDYGENMHAAFDNGYAQSFLWRSAKGERDNAFGTAGLTAQIGNHFGVFGYYNPIFGGSEIVSHAVLVGVNYNF